MSKDHQPKDQMKAENRDAVLEAKKLIKERLIWQHLARKKIKNMLRAKCRHHDDER